MNDDSEIQRFISKVNSAISPFHMRLKAGVSEADGKRFYALINLKDDELSRCATMFKGDEMKYYKKLVSCNELKWAEENSCKTNLFAGA